MPFPARPAPVARAHRQCLNVADPLPQQRGEALLFSRSRPCIRNINVGTPKFNTTVTRSAGWK
jgi:hypothetical protein